MTLPNKRRATAQAFLAASCVGSLMSPIGITPAAAQEDQQALGGVTVTESVIVEEKGKRQESPKATRPVRDTPQTVTIITAETVEQQNLLTLRDMLSTVPGITFGAAEGGTPPSDQINFRGYSATNDITQDGVRDSAAYSRSDSFNLEQLEVTNGANSVTTGAGSVGGSINIVTKRPLAETRTVVSAGIGTDDYYRGTVDANLRVNDLIAVRLNAMGHKNGIPGRDVEKNERWGVAPSVTIGIEGPTKLTLLYLHQEDNNIPQYGVPYYTNATTSGPVPGVDRGAYFGYRNVDRQDITVDQATAIAEHEFSDTVSIRNLARWQSVTQLSVVGPPQGTYCLASGMTPAGAPCTVNVTGFGTFTVPNGYYYIGGPRGNYRDSKNELMYDQIDLRAAFNTGAIEHTLVLGGSASWEKYTLVSGNALRNPDGTAFYTRYPLVNIANPDEVVTGPALPAGFTYGSNVYTGPVNLTATGRQVGEVTNYALYLFDTMKLGKIELTGGVRWESNSGSNVNGLTTQTRTENDAKLFSYRVGLLYKPVEAVSLYAAYGNSKTPSQSSVNGSCNATTNCNVKPEGAKNYEIGAKAELAEGLLLSIALFRNERDSYRVDSGDPLILPQQLDGHSRVDGVALSAVGKITPAWSITANYTYLDSELIQSVSDYCLANPGPGTVPPLRTCTNSASDPDPLAGAELANTPKHSGSLFTTYALPFGLRLGYGVTYQGSFAFAATNVNILRSHAYWVHNAYVAYDITSNLTAQVNVKNLTDKDYYTRIRNNGWATPGDARAAVLSVNYRF
jgi:catecholate siderophore receptor